MMHKLLPLFLLVLLSTSCLRNHQSGYIFDGEKEGAILSGMDKSDVLEKLGTPTVTFGDNEEEWYYIAYTHYYKFFSSQKVKKINRIMKITFDDKNKIKEISNHIDIKPNFIVDERLPQLEIKK